MPFFTLEKINRLLADLKPAIDREVVPIPTFKFHAGDLPRAERVDWDDSAWQDFPIPGFWGGYDQIAWFQARVDVPASFRGHKAGLRFLVGPRDGYGSTAETMLYVNGSRLQAIDYWHEQAVLPPALLENETLAIALRAWSGVLKTPPRRNFKLAQLVRIDPETESLYHLARTIALALPQLDENDLRRVRLLELLNQAFLRLDFVHLGDESFYACVPAALDFLTDGFSRLQRDELKPRVIAAGHSHIDLAWLWRMQHTREKAERTFTTVLNLMAQYPEYHYSQSTPQLYDFIRQDHPCLFASIQQRVREGRWEPLGASWVEMDTLLPSAESLVRQVLFGKRFFHQQFGVDPKILWLPDSFGFSGILPTILRGAGVEGFFTAVVSYSKFDRFPYDTFRWRAADGSEVLVNFITTPAENGRVYNYIGRLEPYDTLQTWNNNRQKAFLDEVLLPFGWGDGGGGPTVEMLEQARAMRNLPGIPFVEVGKVEPFFQRLQQRVAQADLPVVDGEIYLENLRGSYTSQARQKRANRKAEVLYHDAEWLSTLADVLTGANRYPAAALTEGWQIILRNQFHDILSGTSLPEVHADALAELAQAQQIGHSAWDAAQSSIAAAVAHPQTGVLVFNPTGWETSGVVELPWSEELDGKSLSAPDGSLLAVQRAGEMLLAEARDVPACGYHVFPVLAGTAKPVKQPVTAGQNWLENNFFRLELNERGEISLLKFGADRRDVIPPGQSGNQLQFFEDRPLDGEAWQIEPFYQEKTLLPDLVERVIEEAGPLRATLRQTWRFNHSTITQRISAYAGSPRIDFHTRLDWHEQHVMLKVAFPVQVRARTATYDIGFAAIERPTHWNTPFDAAHFENPAHQWADLSQPDFGVAILNDCKYGHDIKDHTLRLTLHRSPTDPDPSADQGEHHFTYSLLPHAGDWRLGGVIAEARRLNDPLKAGLTPANPAGSLPARFGLVSSPNPSLVIETIKQAEEGGGWIVRVREAHQVTVPAASLEFGLPLRRAVECNLLEEEIAAVKCSGSRLVFELKPFEVKTFRVWF